jgi:hypothetical protein
VPSSTGKRVSVLPWNSNFLRLTSKRACRTRTTDSLSPPFVKGKCKGVYEPFLCWQSATLIIAGECLDGADAPSSVTSFLTCSEWCTESMRVCMPSDTPADIHEQCSKFTFAAPGLECMDSQGMRSAVAA